MKISLVVASGVHQGKVINIPGAQFLIGRDEVCNLRPASPAISKKHCAIFARDEKVFAKDMGSTNGTFVNDEQIEGEREIINGDRLRVGPLDFMVSLVPSSKSDATPLPDATKNTTQSKSEPVVKKLAAPEPSKAEQSTASAKSLPTPAAMPKPKTSAPASADDDPDKMAAMLLSMNDDDSGTGEVPGGSTIMELPAIDATTGAPADPKAGEKKKIASQAETSSAASEILRKYMRRPK